MPFPTRRSPLRINALSTPAEAACLREFGYRDPASPLEEATSEEPRVRGPRTCPHAPPPGEGDLLRLQQRFHRLTETMRRATDRLRAIDQMCEMMARPWTSSRDEEDQDQAYPDQTRSDQAGLIAEGDVPKQEQSG